MCRITIPCGCSLSAKYFDIPKRYTGCEVTSINGIPTVTKIYHRNIAPVLDLINNDIIEEIQGYHEKINELYPPVEIPKIEFAVNNFSQYVESSNRFKTNYTKALRLMNEGKVAFQDKIDELYNKTTDFSDVVMDSKGGPFAAIRSFFTDLLGGQAWAIISLIFSFTGFLIITTIIVLLQAIPTITQSIEKSRRNKADDEFKEELLKKLDGVNTYTFVTWVNK